MCLAVLISAMPLYVPAADVPVKTGLSLWLDASDSSTMTLDGTTVNEWRDKMGGSTKMTVANGTPTLVSSGIGGVPTVHFDTSAWMNDGVDHATPVTIFFVSRQTGGNNARVLGAVNNNWTMGYWNGGYDEFFFEGACNSWFWGGYPSSDANAHLYAITMSGSASAIYTNGAFFEDVGGAPGPNSLQLNGYSGGNEQSDCDISEVLVYDSVLDSTDLNLVGGYLSWKYGLTTSYPVWSPSPVQWAVPGVSNITVVSAQAYANLTVNGDSNAVVKLYWGTTDPGPTNTGWQGTNDLGTVSTGLVQGAAITGLTGDTKYYYRFYATNSVVTNEGWSVAASFTTMFAPGDFVYKIKILFTNYAGSEKLTNFPALVRFTTAGDFYGKFASANGYDLRFTSADGLRLNHEVDQWNSTGESIVWVQVPEFTNNCYVWAYFGNAGLTSAAEFTTNGSAWNDGFRAVYHMNQILDTDSAARGHNAYTSYGTISSAAGMIGKANDFTRNSAIQVPQSADFKMGSLEYTLSAWIYTRDTSVHGIFGTYNAGFIFTVWDQYLSFHTDHGVAWQGSALVSPNAWHLVTVAHRGSDVYFYVDGVLGDTRNDNADINSADKELQIGIAAPDHGWWMDGRIDEPRIECKGRSEDWVVASYSNQVVGSTFVTLGTIVPVQGIANLPATNVTASTASLNALFYAQGTGYYATVYWGQSNAGTNAGMWAHTNVLGYFSDTGLTNLSYNATVGLSQFGVNYFTWRVTNGAFSAWATPSMSWTSQREWKGTVGWLWATPGNWLIDNVPDNPAESTLFAGSGSGDVDLDEMSYTNVSMTFTGGDYSIIDTNASPGSLWEGTLLNAGGANTIAVGMTVTGTTEVAGGTLTLAKPSGFSAAELKLNGGTLGVQGAQSYVMGLNHYGYLINNDSLADLNNNGGLMTQTPWGSVTLTDGPDGRGLDFNSDQDFMTAGAIQQGYWDDYMNLFLGYFNPPTTGSYSFRIEAADDPVHIWLDKNNNGVFENSNTEHIDDATVTLTGGLRYMFAVTHREGGGGSECDINFTTPVLSDRTIKPTEPAQAGLWTMLGNGPVNLTSVPVRVVANSAVIGTSGTNIAALGALAVTNNATLSLAAGSPVGFQGTTIPANMTVAGFNSAVDAYLTQSSGLDGSGAAVTIAKSGTGMLILNRAGSNLGSATFNVQTGSLVGVHADAFGAGALQLSGGQLLLSSPGGDIAYTKDIAVSETSTLTAGKAGNGLIGPLTVLLSGAINFSGTQSLTNRATDSYTLRLGGEIQGNGTLVLASGNVIIADTNFNAVSLSGGSLTVYSNMTVNSLVQTSGTFTMAGVSRDLNVANTLTLAGTLNFSGGPNLVLTSATVTLDNGADVTYDKALTTASLTINNGGTLNLGTNALSVGTLVWRNGGTLNMTGPISSSGSLSFWPERTIANLLSGSGGVNIGYNPEDSWGYVALTGTNDYTGPTQIGRGALRVVEGVGLPVNSRIIFNQDTHDEYGVLELSGTFTRSIGQNAGEVYWANRGGFSAFGGNLIVTLEGGAALDWSSSTIGFNNSSALQFGSPYADGMVELKNTINLNNVQRNIQVCNNSNVKTDFVRLSGTISGNGSWNGTQLRFNESSGNNFFNAFIELTGTNTFTQRLLIDYAAVYAVHGEGLPAGSTLYFEGNDVWEEAILLSKGTLTRLIGNDTAGQVYWGSHGGFAARGGPLTISLEGGAGLNWGDGNTGFRGQWLQMGSMYADNLVDLTNSINLAGNRPIMVFDNVDTDQDVAKLSGVISGAGNELRKYGNDTHRAGTLWLSGANTYSGRTFIDQGVIRAVDGVGLPTGSQLYFEADNADIQCVLESSGTFTRNINNTAGDVYWEGQGGGFAAWGGPLLVSLEGGVELQFDSNTIGFNNRRLHLGSRSANNVVTLQNAINLNAGWRYVNLFNNIYSTNDYAVLAGNIRNGYLDLRGDGVVKLTGTNTLVELLVRDTATVMFNGQQQNTGRIGTEGAACTIGGNGVIQGPRIDIYNNATLAPGDGVGTLTTAISDGNGFRMEGGSTYAWQLGPASSDKVAQTGNLRLESGWKVKLIGAGGSPRASVQYDLFTYSGSCTFSAPTIVTNGMPADWVASGVTVVHDPVGKRVYLTGLYSLLSVANDQPTDLTSTSATLNGFVSAQAEPLYVSVFWSTNDGGTSASAWLTNGFVAEKGAYSGVVGQPVSHPITGLNTNELWYYTLRATNSTGTINLWAIPSMSFSALGPPIVTNTGASGIAAGVATLNGAFVGHNRGTVTFCWGTTDGGTNSILDWQFTTNIGAQAGSTFLAGVSSVLYPVSYVYRCYAVNPYGEAWADPVAVFSQTTRPGPHLPVTANLEAWYDASTLVLGNGDAVTAWTDSSTNGRNLVTWEGTPNFKTNAINGLPAVNFRNESLQMAVNKPYFPKDVYLVFRSDSGNSGFGNNWNAPIGVKDGDDNNRMWMLEGNNDRFWDQELPSAVSRNAVVINPANNFDMGDVNTSQYMVLKVTAGPNNGTHVREIIVGSRTDAWNGGQYDTAEVIAYSTMLSVADEALLGGYLANKYAIASYAPVVVPYRVTPSIRNRQATGVGVSSGTMNARLSCTGAVYDAWVFWGTSDGMTNPVNWDTGSAYVGTVTDAAATVSYTINPGAGTWWYTFLASNSADMIWATPSTNFTTVASPTVNNSTGALTAIGQATLRGELTAGVQADVYVYWGRTDGGQTTNWEHEIKLADTPQGSFQTVVSAGYGFNYSYICRASNEAADVWAPASSNFAMPLPPGGYTYTDGLRGSAFMGLGADPNDLSDASYTVSFTRVFTGTKAGTVLQLSEDPAKNCVVTSQLAGFGMFPGGLGGDNFSAVLSGAFFPPVDGSYRFRGDCDDFCQFWIDMNGNGVFESTDAVAAWDWHSDGNKTLVAGQEYRILMLTKENGGGESLNLYYTVPGQSEAYINPTTQPGQWRYATGFLPGEPAITNTPVVNLGQSSATLKGIYTSRGFAADIYAYWGTTDGQDVAGNWQSNRFIGTFHSDSTLSLAVSNLALTTRHYYRFMLTNAVTNIWAAPSGQFDTVGQPTVSNTPATGISQTRATLGLNQTAGGKGVLRIYWGLADGLTDPAAWQNTNDFGELLMGSYTTTVAVRAGAPYYYRAYATNEIGEDWADETATFQTAVPSVSLSVQSAGSFLPTNIAGCQAWYDSSVGVTQSAGRVTVWVDRSGNGHNAVPGGNNVTVTNGVVNGRPALQFNNSYLDAQNSMVVHSTYMVFKSGRYMYEPGNPNLWGPDWSAPMSRQDGGGWMLRPGDRNFWEGNPPSAISQNGIRKNDWSTQLDNVDQYMVLKVNANTANWDNNTGYRLGGNGGYINGRLDVAEIVAYNRVLSPAEENQIGAYLAGKYGITTTYGMQEKDGQAIVTATLSAPSVSNVTVNFSFAGVAVKDTDYTSSANSVVITNGTWSSGILLSSTDDADQEENESLSVGIASLGNATSGAPASASTTITSDDPQVTNQGDATGIAESNATLNGVLTMGDSAVIKVFWGVTDPGMTFTGWNRTNILGTNNEDTAFSTNITGLIANKTYYYRYYATNSSMLAEDWADTASSFMTTVPSVSVNDISITEGNSGTKNFTFTLTISTLSDIDVSVNVATRDGLATTANNDYIATNATVTILANQPSATFTVKVVGDTVYEYPLFADEMFYVDLTAPSGCTISDDLGVATIVNDDTAPAPITNYTWTPTAAGTYNWDNTGPQHNWGTWLGGAFPSNTDDTANMNIGLAGAQYVNLNRTNKVGTLNIGDTDSGYYGMTISNGTGGCLVFDVSSGSALLSKATAANSATDTIAATVILNDPLVVSNAASGALTISGPIGNNSLTKTGAGTLILNNIANTLIGIAVSGGTLEGTGGSLKANVALSNGANVTFNHALAGSYGKVVSGTGSLTKTGNGEFSLTTNQTYTGDTLVSAGTLKLAGGGGGLPVTANLVAHYDAGVGVTSDGSGVLTWSDQSGNGHHGTRANGTPTLVPNALNGLPVVEFRGNDDWLNVANNMRTKEQYVVVRSPNGVWSEHGAFLGRMDDRQGNYLTQQGDQHFHSNVYPDQVSRNGVDKTAQMNDGNQLEPITSWMILKIVVNDNRTDPTSYCIGRGDYSGVECDIAEIIGYSTTLSSEDENKVGAYLAEKYGITTTYPSGGGSGVDILPTNTVLRIAAGARVENSGSTNTVDSLYLDGQPKASGTWGATGSDCEHTNDTYFSGSGLLVVLADRRPVAAPTVSNGSGATPGESLATLHGELLTEVRDAVTAYMYWGESDGGTDKQLWEHVITNGIVEAGQFASNTSPTLVYGKAYYYRTYATNAAGDGWAPSTEMFCCANPLVSGNRLKISFTNYTGSALANFPALVKLSTNITGFSYSNFLSADGYDLRFWNGEETTNLNYEIEQWDTNGESIVWVQVPVFTNNCYIWATWGDEAASNQPAYTTNGATFSENFVGVWHLADTVTDEATSGAYRDSSTNLNDGAQYGTGTSTGLVGRCGDFDGNDYILVPDQPYLNYKDYVTASIWVKCVPPGWAVGWQMFVTKGSDSYWDLRRVGGGNTIAFCLNNGNNAGGETNVQDGAWHQIVGAYSQSSPLEAKIYLDGHLYHTFAPPNPLNDTTGVPLEISGRNNGNYSHRGLIDELRVSRAYRSGDWIRAEYDTIASHDTFTTYEIRAGGRTSSAIENLAATNVTQNSARFQGVLNASGAVYNVSLHWGPTDGSNSLSGWMNVVSIGSFTNVSTTNLTFDVAGTLTPGTTYYYAFRGSNAVTNAWAQPSIVFYTLGPPIVDNGDGATPAIGSATLTGEVLSTGGAPTTVYTYWGDNDGNTDRLSWDRVITNGLLETGPFSGIVSNLLYGQRYYYRTYATNENGGAWAPSSTAFLSLSPTLPGSGGSIGVNFVSANDAAGGALLSGLGGPVPQANWNNVVGEVEAAWGGAVFGADAIDLYDWNGTETTCDVEAWYSNGGATWFWARNQRGRSQGVGNEQLYLKQLGNDEATHLQLVQVPYGTYELYAAFGPVGGYTVGGVSKTITTFTDPSLGLTEATAANGWTGNYVKWSGLSGATVQMTCDDGWDNSSYIDWVQIVNSLALQASSSITNNTSTDVTNVSATVSATLAASSSVFNVYVYYGTVDGTNNAGGLWETNVYVGSYTNVSPTNLSTTISGLAPVTAYYWTFSAQNAATNIWATPSKTFTTTGPVAPAVNNAGGATLITGSGATLNGAFAGFSGSAEQRRIYWGTTDAGTNAGAWGTYVDIGSGGSPFLTAVACSPDTLYYYRSWAEDDGVGYWSPNTYVWMAQTRTRGSWHLASIPVAYGAVGSPAACMNSNAGAALAVGMFTNATDINADFFYVQSNDTTAAWAYGYLHSSTNWLDVVGNISTFGVQPGMGFWLKRSANGPATDYCGLTGPKVAATPTIVFPANKWRAFGWPRGEVGTTSLPLGWGFSNGTKSATMDGADLIFAEYSNRWYLLYLNTDGKWYRHGDVRAPTSVKLQPGKGYYYYHRGSEMTWAPPAY